MEEDKARSFALRAIEEKKMLELENDKKKLELEVSIQQEMLKQLMNKVDQRETLDKEIAGLVVDELGVDNSQEKLGMVVLT